MSRYVCIHGHFYQPPRENPWLEEIELQESAYPYHDWNERITAECYDPNAASRILDEDMKIIDITDNYDKISFNFGPTLLSWFNAMSPDTLKAIVASDKTNKDKFSGHCPAMAQAYNHLIMPLANSRDKRTQVIWGIAEFEHRYGRRPEGMWLPEMAVDLESLDLMAEQGIKFVVLDPHQIGRFRNIGEEAWKDASKEEMDIKMPYLCRLKSGRTINIFAYNGPISKDVAFSNLLDNGENFANRLLGAFSDSKEDQIVSIATDGETYGHHHPNGDMALAYCLYHLESNGLARITIYGEYLEKHPPSHEAEIVENTSWSCIHGIERWRSDCGCNTGTHPGWNQKWRGPLRTAMNWLRDALIPIYEKEAAPYLKDPWQARDDYIHVILDRSIENVSRFLSEHAAKELSSEESIKVLNLLGMQRQALLMFTSCGWFFDEISGIETTQVMKYAARAMQLARHVSGADLEPEYNKILGQAASNIPGFGNGANIYDNMVKPAVVDLNRVTAHYAISSLFKEYPEAARIFSYTVKREAHDIKEAGIQKLAIGRVRVRSDLTWDEAAMSFAVIYFDGHYVSGGVLPFAGDEKYEAMKMEIEDAFAKSDIPEVIRRMDKNFGDHNYGMWHLFKDAQNMIFRQILKPQLQEIQASFKQIYDHHYPAMQVMKNLGVAMPPVLGDIRKYILNSELEKGIEDIDTQKLQNLADEIGKWPVDLDPALVLTAGRNVERLMNNLKEKPDDVAVLQTISSLVKMLNDIHLEPNLWKSQNILFAVSRQHFGGMRERADKGDGAALKWLELFQGLENYMHVRT
jgi:alpha-amylase/alpha-mannosidase (GH57 family)